jgi:septal ring factor EnvC (AmiA/AmiB activator)
MTDLSALHDIDSLCDEVKFLKQTIVNLKEENKLMDKTIEALKETNKTLSMAIEESVAKRSCVDNDDDSAQRRKRDRRELLDTCIDDMYRECRNETEKMSIAIAVADVPQEKK